MNWTLPNTLTTLRLLAAPGTAVMFLYFNRPWADWFALVLFLGAAITDWFDGYLARLWKQESKFGAMLDPIADKAMVVIALVVITGFSGMNPWLLLPTTVIIFREVFVSGLREYLGNQARALKVTKLAKWKTTAQMVAIAVLFASGVGTLEDPLALHLKPAGIDLLFTLGRILLWIAAGLTLQTGWDYFIKAIPLLKDEAR
jgi:CDP-diacylglycerol--glycerol-3-phosphate 3-phosphatidyltransferase